MYNAAVHCDDSLYLSLSLSLSLSAAKVRRLYDIANVLTTLDLIRKKTFMARNHRKMPGYVWCGPTMEEIDSVCASVRDIRAMQYCGEEDESREGVE